MRTIAQQVQKSKPLLKTNVSTLERILMVTSGAYLIYNGLSKENKSITKAGAGGAMLLRGISGYCPVYDAAGHLMNDKASNINIRLNTIINKPVGEVFDFWRNLENLPKFMSHLASVKTIDETTSEWTAKGPAGIGSFSWKAKIVKDRKDKLLAWLSLDESTIRNAGKVTFKSHGNTTELGITISYHAPLGIAGERAAKLLNPYFEKLVKDDIANLKNHLESN
ncbi:putative membrane protein [Flavobacterium sp. HSC-32F16]|uniref:SRPBCC family protein n=1 Tax=Flavobacterium sp. HSC-32F16 TaxID=2910964 RepID=UPI0020A3A0CF|nr:SRPBCC family protein [Flavobacterium sp. HSC-32F16]MCP2025266.1 putative membrane protein [Flavobacterium sp. HSC-32F16]